MKLSSLLTAAVLASAAVGGTAQAEDAALGRAERHPDAGPAFAEPCHHERASCSMSTKA